MRENGTRMGVVVEPLDPLLFRDGRPFEEGSHAATGLPLPQTLAAALRTWLFRKVGFDLDAARADGRDRFEQKVGQSGNPEARVVATLGFRGPWFALADAQGTSFQPLVPLPATILQVEDADQFIRLDPMNSAPLPGWSPLEDGMLPLWWHARGPAKRPEGHHYLKPDGLETFLKGGVPTNEQMLSGQELLVYDRRTGIGMEAETLAAKQGRIYSLTLLQLRCGVRLYAEVTGPADALNRLLPKPTESAVLPLGGEGRRAILRTVPAFPWPSAEPSEGQKPLLLLTSPGLFDKNPANQGTDEERKKAWRPTLLKDNLVSAAVPGYVALSGWDLTRGRPKPTRFAAAAGSVYFLKQPLSPMPEALYTDPKDIPQGWGSFLKGVWTYV